MSRHTKLNKIIQDALDDDYDDVDQGYDDVDYDGPPDRQEIIQTLQAMFEGLIRSEAENALITTNWYFDDAVEFINQEIAKKKKKIPKSSNENSKKPETKKQLTKEQKQAIQQLPQIGEIKHRNSSKISQHQEKIVNLRKISHQIEQIETYHYNQQYPKVNNQPHPISTTIAIVIVGHVDAGKSTLVGQVLHLLNQVSKKQIHKNQKESKEMNKQSFQFAWVVDQGQEQRLKGVTIDVGLKKFKLNDKNIIFLDSPGHKQFIPNMITGAVQADYAILVVDVTRFESGFTFGGQTKEHAYIVKSLGVTHIIVAMNKMDLIDWKQEGYNEIKSKLLFYLIKIGFLQQHIIFVPLSAFQNLNILSKKQLSYYKGPPLIELISHLEIPNRPIDKPFRLNIANFFESTGGKLKGHCISGKIEGGVLKKQDKLIILPQNCQCLVKQILLNGEKVKSATVGDNIECQIKLLDQTFFQTIKYGNVLSSIQYSIPVSQRFTVQILTFELEYPLLKGNPVVVYIGANKCTGKISKIHFLFDPKNGTILKKNPRAINSNDCCEIEVETNQKICLQLFSNFKIFGRVILREKHSTLAVGTIKKIF